jgi:hypothetical protein
MKNSVNVRITLSLTIAALSLTLGIVLLYPNHAYSQTGNCDPAYPDVCIASPPPDLNCADVPDRGFTVLPPDPHGFDRDGDGVGCES